MSTRPTQLAALAAALLCFTGTESVAAAPAEVAKAAAPGPSASGYVLGQEDVVEVSVLGRTDFSVRTKIGTDGAIQLPYLGNFPAANLTAIQLRDQIQTALERGGYFAKPVVSVNIVSYASRYAVVLGSVPQPGLIPIDRPYHLSEIIARVGGIRDDGADYVILRSGAEGAPERRVLLKTLATGDTSDDPMVSPGDKVYVPHTEMFYISGQVKSPGTYNLSSDMTLRMALSRGGGLTQMGSDHKITITRAGKKLDHVNLDDQIRPDDVIVIGERLF